MHQPDKKITVVCLQEKKRAGEKITAVTAYDYTTSRLADQAGIDIVLVGDSLGMVFQGHKNTLSVTLDEMIYHTRQVARAEPQSLIVADMPFQSFHISPERTVENAIRCIKEGGAEAVKLEGGRKRFAMIEAILRADIPVMGHLGLTPQSVHMLGGFIVQGKLKEKASEIIEDALAMEKMGVFSIVLESIPKELAQKVSAMTSVPTIGIGAGPHCDGQVLVFPDLVGMTGGAGIYLPKFVRKYADTYAVWLDALKRYAQDVRSGSFPGEAESYHLHKDIDEFLK